MRLVKVFGLLFLIAWALGIAIQLNESLPREQQKAAVSEPEQAEAPPTIPPLSPWAQTPELPRKKPPLGANGSEP
jgi:hypothetical protein